MPTYLQRANDVAKDTFTWKRENETLEFKYINVPDRLWSPLIDELFSGYPKWRRRLTGGFMYDGNIYIKRSRKISRKYLILHELEDYYSTTHLSVVQNSSFSLSDI
jgi:hypothetical protein